MHFCEIPLNMTEASSEKRAPDAYLQRLKAARANGGPVWYLLFDDEGHGFRKKSNSDYFGAASILFWQQHLLGE